MKSYSNYKIREESGQFSTDKIEQFSRNINIHPLVAQLLAERGISTEEDAKAYLLPQLSDVPSPYELKGMKKGVELIKQAVDEKMQIVIHGDYDVDGITGTALLVDFFRLLDLEVIYHLPNRMVEGYGLSIKSIETLAAKVTFPAVLITVDNGINSSKEVQFARELGFKVIVTDHHQPGDSLPDAHSIINPVQQGCNFTKTNISGIGVAFFFIMAIRREMVKNDVWQKENMPNLKQYLDLVALGTVADVMELTDLNRTLVKAGLEVISSKNRLGIDALCEVCNLKENSIRAEDISFRLAPRINAAGRLGKPELAAKLLMAKKSADATLYAEELNQANLERRELEQTALNEAIEQSQKQVDTNKKGLVVYGANWHPGVLGIIASRIVEKFNLPVFVMTDDKASSETNIKGSGRSVDSLNLFRALEECKKHLKKFGGHAMAAGLSLKNENYELFSEAFDRYVKTNLSEDSKNNLLVDMQLAKSTNLKEMTESLKLMEPFGRGNHEPVFLLKLIQMDNVTKLRDHLKFSIRIGGAKYNGIGFYMASLFERATQPVDLCFKIKNSTFRGTERVEVHAVDIFASI